MKIPLMIFLLLIITTVGVAQNNGNIRDKAILTLKETITTPDGRIIDFAISALGSYGDSSCIDLIWRRYETAGTNESKSIAIEAIGRLGDKDQIDRLMSVFESADPFSSRADLIAKAPSLTAGMALLNLQDRSGILVMNSYLKGRDRQLQRRATKAFAEMREDSSVHLIVELLDNKNLHVRESAIEALAKLSKPGDPYTIASLKPLISDDSSQIRLASAKALGILGDKSGKDILEEELKQNKYKPELLRILYDLGDNSAPGTLVSFLVDDLSENERNQIEKELISIVDESSIEELIKLLDSEKTETVLSTLRILSRIKAESSVDAILLKTESEEEKIRDMAVDALGLTGSRKAIPLLRETLDELRESGPFEIRRISFRNKVAVALGDLGDETGIQYFLQKSSVTGEINVDGAGLARITNRVVVPEIIRVIDSHHSRITPASFISLVSALEKFNATEALPVLIARLEEKGDDGIPPLSPDETVAVLRFLGNFGGRKDAVKISRFLDDNNLNIRTECAISILKLTKEDAVFANE